MKKPKQQRARSPYLCVKFASQKQLPPVVVVELLLSSCCRRVVVVELLLLLLLLNMLTFKVATCTLHTNPNSNLNFHFSFSFFLFAAYQNFFVVAVQGISHFAFQLLARE